MIEIRFHGRGGQGAVTLAELLAHSAIEEGKFAQAFPSFGPERRGAPVAAYARVDTKQILHRTQIKEPDIVVVLDESLIKTQNVSSGLKQDGIIIINSHLSPDDLIEKYNFKQKVASVDALKIAFEKLGVPITNTTMLGALVGVSKIVSLSSAISALKEKFPLAYQKNIDAMETAYKSVKVSGEKK